ncbi:hypothetical protein G6F56_005248 [Rhizopus delemar]|nr:hypothetical protein G6F56_005248 [Rhizopus delemar]
MDIEREDKINGVEIPRQVSEELDNTPTHQLNENFKKFRRETQRYVMGERTTPEKINKSVAHYLKKHFTETAMAVAMEIFEQLQYVLEEADHDEAKDIINRYREQSRRLAVFGLATAKAQEREAKEYADKALNIPLSIRHLETTEEDNKSKNAYSDEFLIEEEDEAMDSQVEDINEGIETSDMKEPNTNHHTNQTTPPTPNNINDKLQYPNRRHSARGPITTFSQELAVDHQTSMALIRDTRWLSDTTIKKTSALEIASYQIRPDEQLAVDEAVTKFVQAGIIEVSPIQNTDYLSNFFTIQNTDYLSNFFTIQEATKHAYVVTPIHPQLKEILDFPEQGNYIPIQNSSFWDERKSTSIQQNDAICDKTITTTRNSSSILFSRHMCSGDDKGRSNKSHTNSIVTYGILGFSDKLPEECSSPFSTTGILRLRVQYEEHADSTPSEEDVEAHDSNQTSHKSQTSPIQLSVVCQYDGEDDLNDSSHWRSPTPHQIHAEGSVLNTQQTPTELGCTNDIIERQQERASMVDKLDGKKEWPANKEISMQPTESNDDICRCIRPGMGNEFWHNTDHRRMDKQRKPHVNQCKGADSYIFCPETTCQRLQGPAHKNIYRQHDCFEIQQQVGRDSISNTTRPSSENTRTVQPIQSQSRIRTHFRTGEYSSGLAEKTAPHHNEKLTLRGPDEHKAAHILEHAPRSGSNSNGCVSTNLEEAGNVLISALEVHITSDADNKTTKNPEGGADHAVLADPILVPIITTDETCQQTSNVQDEKMEDGRLALICSKRKAFGNLEEDNVEFLTHVQRSKTHKNYNAEWKKWTQWCKTQPNSIQPTTYDEAIVELENKEPVSAFIHFREAKETQVKSVVLGLAEDNSMCLVSTLFSFLQQSSHLRNNLPIDHSSFLAYILEPEKVKSASPSTVATWVSKAMDKAGIDTSVYKPHSIRSASSTKAVENGMTISEVKHHANWSHDSNTFER